MEYVFPGDCFSREAARQWASIAVLGQMCGCGAGETGITGYFGFGRNEYNSLNHMYHSDAVDQDSLTANWLGLVETAAQPKETGGFQVLHTDTTTQPRDGRRMPGVHQTTQDSNDSCKREKVAAQKFIATGLRAAGKNGTRERCILLKTELFRDRALCEIEGLEYSNEYEAGMRQACEVSDALVRKGFIETDRECGIKEEGSYKYQRCHEGPKGQVSKSLDVMDSGYYKGSVLQERDKAIREGLIVPDVVIRTRSDARAYEFPVQVPGNRNKKCKGDPVKLKTLFKSRKDDFRTVELETPSGRRKKFEVLGVELIWGDRYYRRLRFILVADLQTGARMILMTTNFSLKEEEILEAYLSRFDIEFAFKDWKREIRATKTLFWSKSLPKCGPRVENGERLKRILELSEESRKKAIKSVRATELQSTLSMISLGLLQLITLECGLTLKESLAGFSRSENGAPASVASIKTRMDEVRKMAFHLAPESDLARFVRERSLSNGKSSPALAISRTITSLTLRLREAEK